MVSSTFMLLFCVTVAGRVSSDGTLSECVDLIELNHFYDRQGKHVYDQVIFYERHPGNGKYHVRAWCLVEDRESLNRRPLRDEVSNLYRVDWLDNDQQVRRSIRSRLFRESWTHTDPERTDKRQLDERMRLHLVAPHKKRLLAEERIAKESFPALEVERSTLVASVDPGQTVAVHSK